MKIKNLSVAAGIMILGMPLLANAASISDRVSVHGYGDTGLIHAIDNNYTNKPSSNNWDYNYLSVNFTAQVDEKTKVIAQIRQGSEITGDMGAYINYNVTDNLTARAGQMKAPVGIFNEIRDIKFLQLSTLEPMMYRDAAGTLPDSFKGVESVYHLDSGAHRFTFDAYGGESKGSNNYVMQAPSFYVSVQNIYGGRLTYRSPIGLKLSLSTFQNDVLSTTAVDANTNKATAAETKGYRKLSSASLDYRKNNLEIKMEYAIATQFQNTASEVNGKSYYGQMGYTFAEKYTPFIRYDYLLYDNTKSDDPMAYQKSKVLGISYMLNNSVSLRMENHWNTGYALPAIVQGSGFSAVTKELNWNIFALGANFIF